MKKILCILLTALLLLCSCATEQQQIEINQTLAFQIEDNYTINFKLVAKEKNCLEVRITKNADFSYFVWKDSYNGTETEFSCDLAIIAPDIAYAMINDTERVDSTTFHGGIAQGVHEVFLIKSFEETINIKFFIREEYQNSNYILYANTYDIKDYGVTKIDAVDNREVDSVINAIHLNIK